MTTATTPNAHWIKRWAADDGRHWVAEADRYDKLNAPAGEALMRAAALQSGERVLDVGCGNGATSLEAAERVRCLRAHARSGLRTGRLLGSRQR
jgi:2-polyprenyl-3-methyl-5-hydroxy-6-metoxy-1,4-benzoquinol methylase